LKYDLESILVATHGALVNDNMNIVPFIWHDIPSAASLATPLRQQ
jgi:hypothetical protein